MVMRAYTRVAWYMPLSTTVGLSRIRNRGSIGRTPSYASPNHGSVGRALDHASVMIHPMDMASLIWVLKRQAFHAWVLQGSSD